MGRLPAGRSVAGVEKLADKTTGAELRIVRLEGGGFVVTSADDLVEPVIAFSETGDGVDTDESNPFWTLLRGDIAAREAAAGVFRRTDVANAQRKNATATGQTEAQRRWAVLLGEGSAISRPREAAKGRSSLSDVRVASLVKSKWSQSTAGGLNCWNCYTPNNYVCGCVATAFGQVMRYWKYPTKAVEAKTKTCAVDGEDAEMTMFGGTYYWDSMPLAPSNKNPPSEKECQAIGKLVYDIGVSVRMDWGYDGSGAVTLEGADALKNDFGYAHAVRVNYRQGSWSLVEFKRATIPNFAAHCPVVLSISRTENGKRFGHAVVADGYGYSDGSFFIHVNFGWAGSSDAWYCPPELDNYTVIEGTVCNIFTSDIGSILSGRVLDSRGVPVIGATVKAFLDDGMDEEKENLDVRDGKSAAVATGMTDSNGIYAFIIPAEGTYKVCATVAEMLASTNVAITATTDSAIGNSHGNDIYLLGSTAHDITLDPQGGIGGTAAVIGTYGSALPMITPPTKTGYSFGGYWTAPNGGGTQYYTASGASARNWNMTGATTLYAKWTVNTYTISLNRPNGIGGTASVTVTYGAAMPSITIPTRIGYTFGGYYTAMNGGGTQYYTSSGASARDWDKTYAATLYAKWTLNTYEIAFHANGGEGEMPNQTNTYGVAVALASNVLTYASHRYLGWATNETGEVVFRDSEVVLNLTAVANGVVNLFAVWQLIAMEVAFDLNYTDAPSIPAIIATNGVAYGALPMPQREGYSFDGWTNGRNTNSPRVTATTIVTSQTNHALYAQWTKNAAPQPKPEPSNPQLPVAKYSVAFNANAKGVNGKMAVQAMAYGKAAKLRKNVFTRKGYVFAGWAKSAADAKKGVIAYTNAQSVKDLRKDGKTTTLYAVWAKPKYKVAFVANGGKGKMAVQTFTYGKATKLSANKFKAPNSKKFAGWATSAANAKKGKVAYKNKAKVQNLLTNGKTVKLYAVWKK